MNVIKVVKGNVVLRVDESQMDYYVSKGFTAKTLDGKIIKEAVPTDTESLKKACVDAKKENEALKNKIAALEAEIESLKSQLNEVQTQPVIVSEDKPKRTRRKSMEE